MSFSVRVIPEDPVQNGHILKPLVQAIMRDAGRPMARVRPLTKPRVRGYDHAVKVIRGELPVRSGFDLFLFFPDADRANADAMRSLETDLEAQGVSLFCCPAQPEVEIYACAAFRADLDGTWEDARAHPRMKEEIFQPLLAKHGDPRRPGGGRDRMIEASLRNVPYESYGEPHAYEPDFIVRLKNGVHVVLEIKGQRRPGTDAKHEAARRWVAAVNHWGGLGAWDFLVCHNPQALERDLSALLARHAPST